MQTVLWFYVPTGFSLWFVPKLCPEPFLFSPCLPPSWVMNSSLWFQRKYNSLWLLFHSCRLLIQWKVRGWGGLIHCVSSKVGFLWNSTHLQKERFLSAAELYLLLILGAFSLPCSIWWNAVLVHQFLLCPRKESRGAFASWSVFLHHKYC